MDKIWKVIPALLVMTAFGGVLSAQDDDMPAGYDNYKPSRVTVLKDRVFGERYQEDKFNGNWAGIFIGFTGLANGGDNGYPEGQPDFPDLRFLGSRVVNLNLIEISAGLQSVRNNIGIVTGLGVEFNVWRFNKNVTIEKVNSMVVPVDVSAVYGDPRRSKFASTWLSVPVLIEFQAPASRSWSRFYFSGGIILNARMASHAKIRFLDDEQRLRKLKTPGSFYMRDLRCSATVRAGYRWVNLFATYDLAPVFRSGHGPGVVPWSVGIGLLTF